MTAYVLSQFKADAFDQDAELTVVILPSRIRIDPEHRAKVFRALGITETSFARPGPSARLRGILTDLGIPFLDLTEILVDHQNLRELYFPIDGHLNAAGQGLIGRQLVGLFSDDVAE